MSFTPSLKLTVQNRIALVSVAFVLGLAVIGFTSWVGQQKLGSAFAQHAAYSELAKQSRQIRADTLGLKTASRDVRFRRTESDAGAFNDLKSELQSAVDSLRSMPEADRFADQIKPITAEIDAIDDESIAVFRALSGLIASDGLATTKDRTSEALQLAMTTAARQTDSPDGARLNALVHEMRRIEASFRNNIDEEALGDWEVARGRFDKLLAKTDMPADAKATLASAMADYAGAFPPWTKAETSFVVEAERLTGSLDVIGPKLRDLDDAVSNGVQAAATALDFARSRIQAIVLVTIALALAIGLAIAVFVGHTTAVPLRRLRDSMLGLAAGRNGTDVPFQARRDEIGEMAKAVQIFKNNGLALEKAALEKAGMEREAAEQRARNDADRAVTARAQSHVVEALAAALNNLMHGNLTWTIETPFAPEYDKLRADFNAAIVQLKSTIREVSTNTSAIRSGTGEISTASTDLSRRTEQQAASLEETAAALDEITATVKKTAGGASHARQVVSAAKADAEQSGEVVRQAVQAMHKIEASSRQVSDIIGVIDEIAFQTNLLALNAGVEAARAGDAGRGFAVVASEVRSLAQRSATSAKEIKALISTSSQQVVEGVELVGKTGKALTRIVAQVAELNGIVADIANSANEQAVGLEQVNTAVNQMDQITQQNAAMVEQSTAASQSLQQETEYLADLVGRFQIDEAPVDQRRESRGSASATVTALKATGRGAAIRRVEVAAVNDDWQHF